MPLGAFTAAVMHTKNSAGGRFKVGGWVEQTEGNKTAESTLQHVAGADIGIANIFRLGGLVGGGQIWMTWWKAGVSLDRRQL